MFTAASSFLESCSQKYNAVEETQAELSRELPEDYSLAFLRHKLETIIKTLLRESQQVLEKHQDQKKALQDQIEAKDKLILSLSKINSDLVRENKEMKRKIRLASKQDNIRVVTQSQQNRQLKLLQGFSEHALRFDNSRTLQILENSQSIERVSSQNKSKFKGKKGYSQKLRQLGLRIQQTLTRKQKNLGNYYQFQLKVPEPNCMNLLKRSNISVSTDVETYSSIKPADIFITPEKNLSQRRAFPSTT